MSSNSVRLIVAATLVGALTVGLLAASRGAYAQTPPATTATATPVATPLPETGEQELGVALFPWAFEDGGFSGNYLRGLVLYLLGTVGARIAVYSTLGDFLPSMGRGEYNRLDAELQALRRQRDETLKQRKTLTDRGEDPPADLSRLSDSYMTLVKDKEASLSRLRWRLILMGVPLYIVLGGFAAAAIASSLTLALAIGFGWTAVLDRVGLGRELAKATPERAEAVDELERETRAARAELNAMTAENQRLAERATRYNELVEDYRQAQAALRTLVGAAGGQSPSAAAGGAPPQTGTMDDQEAQPG